ncbi:NADH-ubiquinone oxidoreductase 29.9 kDa subunit [Trichodelitschia bisporula]|uniref:NADH-ubiquinone oxidoreductase 29.9 kDa subunit n=1 Tax=Trichodelitschia bisporula TaxID=703511 RepID=A0A6G1I654_9PEZI|nr:NADH-ubiquinone oxidoreductase 29.9 kDa subunit [Trichodelitschia bisporula]
MRLFAAVRQGRFLQPGTPTGLTGLLTHPAPRSTLIYLYSRTLDKLKAVPESSVYRQATENVTKKRLAIIESYKPEGYDAWMDRVGFRVGKFQEETKSPALEFEGRQFVMADMAREEKDDRDVEWDGERLVEPALEGPRFAEERGVTAGGLLPTGDSEANTPRRPKIEPEPLLTAEQVSEIENKIGAGLLEEVIQVAEGELKLVDTMIEHKVWEELAEQPPEGQWVYFERGLHNKGH